MLPHVLHHPPHLDIPKYIPQYHKLAPSASFLEHLPRLESPSQSDSPADTVDDDNIPSPLSPPGSSGNFHYVRGYDSPTDIYESDRAVLSYTNSYPPNYSLRTSSSLRDSSDALAGPYLSDSPSPVDVHHTTSFPHPLSAPHSQDRFSHPSPSLYQSHSGVDRSSGSFVEGYSANYSQPLLDQRRMSEPSLLASSNAYSTPATDPTAASRYQQFSSAYNIPPRFTSPHMSSLHRGTSTGSLREMRHHHSSLEYHSQRSEDEAPQHHLESFHSVGGLDEPISPLQPTFSGGASDINFQYSPTADDHYGPSPPGTGTSTSSTAPIRSFSRTAPHISSHTLGESGQSNLSPAEGGNNSKTYSFVALPGNAIKKRPRRRYDEIERLYRCSWPDCTKAYGTLNHLNAHVTMQKHGSKRSPNEFKELRKLWRKAKKDSGSPIVVARRNSMMSMRHEEVDMEYDDAYYYVSHPQFQGHSHQRPHSFHGGQGVSTPIPIPRTSSEGLYNTPHNELYGTSDGREDRDLDYGPSASSARHRYSDGQDSPPTSWQQADVAPASSRSNMQYLSSSLPLHLNLQSSSHQQQQQHNLLPHLNLSLHIPSPHQHPSLSQVQGQGLRSPANITISRLPADSTLLTPLPGYEPPSLLAPPQTDLSYPADSYEGYDDDGSGRPDVGHQSLGRRSGDEY